MTKAGIIGCGGCPGKKLADRAGILARSSGTSGRCPYGKARFSALSRHLKKVIVIGGIGKKPEILAAAGRC